MILLFLHNLQIDDFEDEPVSDVNWNTMSNLELKSGHKIGTVEPIFPKIEQSVIDEEQSKLGN